MKENENNPQIFIGENIPEIYSTAAATLITPFDIRLIFFNDDMLRGEIFEDNILPAVKNAKCEIILPPKVAKSVGKLLLKEVERYEKNSQKKITNDKL